MSALLIITTGHTDVQLLIEGERRNFDQNCYAALDSELAQRTDWSLKDSAVAKSSSTVTVLPSGAFQLCTPKLDAVLDHASRSGIIITDALVLGTRRDPGKSSGDPGQAATVLARRLRERLGIEATVDIYLSGDERMEDPSNPRDAHVRREVTARIDGACRKAIEDVKPTSIFLATTGGHPTVRSLVEQIVRLRACETPVKVVDVPDASRTGSDGLDRAVERTQAPSHTASFETRRHALELIRKGHLLGAWGAVRHLHADSEERRWTTPIEWLYLWASSLPLPESCDIELLKHPRRSVRAALRVELALRASDVPSAVHGTVAFFESALWDHLDRHLQAHPVKSRLFSASPTPPSKLVRPGKGRPFEVDATVSDNGVTWYRVREDSDLALRLARDYLHKQHLERLAQAISKVRSLRNDVAHNVPTPGRMAAARKEMQDAKLWSAGDRFMCQDLVTGALIELGVANPESLPSMLLHEMENRLLDYSCASTPRRERKK